MFTRFLVGRIDDEPVDGFRWHKSQKNGSKDPPLQEIKPRCRAKAAALQSQKQEPGGSPASTKAKSSQLQNLETFDAAVVDDFYGDAFVFAESERQRDGAAIAFDEVGIDFGL